MNIFNIEAEYHMPLKNKQGVYFGHRVKVALLDPELGFFINGMVVCPPNEKSTEWSVFTPKQGNARIIEFNGKESKLWPEIKEACLKAVREHERPTTLVAAQDPMLKEGLGNEEFNKLMIKDMEGLGF